MEIKIMCASLLVLFSVMSARTYAQSSDSIKVAKKTIAEDINNQFPSTRFLDVQYEQLGEYKYTTKVNDKEYESGKVISQNRLKLAMNYALIQKKNWVLSASARYKYEHIAFEDVEVPSGGVPVIAYDNDVHFHYLWTSINYTRYSMLWNKPLVSNVTISADASNKNFGMLYGSYLGSLILKRNEFTTVTVGLLVQSNANGISPILPTFSYNHKFKGSMWMLDIILPKQIYVRRQLLKHGRISIGSELDGNPFYFKSEFLANNNKSYMFNRNEFKSGAMFEYRLNKHFIGYAKTGWIEPLNGTTREKYKSDRLSRTQYDGNFYFNFGVSFNVLK